MSAQKFEKSIVGVDVGGTFTDLFCFDEAARTFNVAKVPSQRGDEAASGAMERIASTKASSSCFPALSVGSIIKAPGTISGKEVV